MKRKQKNTAFEATPLAKEFLCLKGVTILNNSLKQKFLDKSNFDVYYGFVLDN